MADVVQATLKLDLLAGVSVPVDEDAAAAQPVSNLRFRWIDGQVVECGDVGGDGWSEVKTDRDDTPGSPGAGSVAAGSTIAGSVAGDGASVAAPASVADDVSSIAPMTHSIKTYRYTKEFPSMSWTEELARRVNDRPHVYIFMGEKSTDGDGNPVDHPWTSHVALDTSALLDGDLQVQVNVCAPAPPNMTAFTATLTTDTPVLSDALRLSLNPLAITLEKAADLPGVTLPYDVDPSMRKHITPSKYSLLEQHCAPVFAVYRLFDGDGLPRVVRTVPAAHGPLARWGQKSVFLLGTFTSEEVREHFLTKPLEVELHDRARSGSAGRVSFSASEMERWEGMIGKPPPPPPKTVDEDEDGEADGSSAAASPEDSKDDGDADAAAAAGEPLDRDGVDEYVIRDIEAALRGVGDDNPHGVAAMQLTKLLSRSNERLGMIQQVKAHRESQALSAQSAAADAVAERKRTQLAARAAALQKLGIGVDATPMSPAFTEVAGGSTLGSPAPTMGSVASPAVGMPGTAVGTPATTTTTTTAADGGGSAVSAASGGTGAPGSGQTAAGAGAGDRPISPVKFTPLWEPGTGHDAIKHVFTVDVAPRKRRIVPKISTEHDLSDGERMICTPASYLPAGTRVRATTTLARPVHTNAPTEHDAKLPFTRAVFVFKYSHDSILKASLSVIEEANMAALQNASSTRSHVFSEEETKGANDGSLDIITGFQVVDDHWRLLVLEGLVDGAMGKLLRRVRRSFPNSDEIRYVADPTVTFASRMYTAFNAAPKDIRLRDPLTALMKQPGLYDRKKVSQLCFDALYALTEIKRSTRLLHLKQLSLFPSPEGLNDMVNKYGDTVTLTDMYGQKKVEGAAHASRFVSTPKSRASTPGTPMSLGGASIASRLLAKSPKSKQSRRVSKHPPMETSNSAFLDTVKARAEAPTRNYVKDYVESVKATSTRRERTLPTDMEGSDAPVYVYSGQKLNYTELQKENMRRRLAKDKRSTFTYSQDFQSLTVCLVNETEISKLEAKAAQKKFTTPTGFQYPAPKDKEEFSKHPKQLSEARKADLREPWDDPHDQPPAHLLSKDHRATFDTVPCAPTTFGYVDAAGTRNPAFFQSVHLSGSGAAAEALEAKKKAEEDWNSKVVVDNVQFRPHYSPKKPTQLHKLEDMLKGPVESKTLRIIHKAKLPSGKRTAPPTAPPISSFSSDAYEDPVDFTTKLKSDDPAHFVGTDAAGNKIGFSTITNPARLLPKSQTIRYQRKAPDMSESEKVGPKWGRRE